MLYPVLAPAVTLDPAGAAGLFTAACDMQQRTEVSLRMQAGSSHKYN